MATILNEATQNMRALLHNDNDKERIIIYYGLAEALTSYIIDHSPNAINNASIAININKVINQLVELAIIDRVLLESIVKKIFKFKCNKLTFSDRMKNMVSWTCLNDAMGVSDCYDTDTMYLINSKFDLYRRAISVTIAYLTSDK